MDLGLQKNYSICKNRLRQKFSWKDNGGGSKETKDENESGTYLGR